MSLILHLETAAEVCSVALAQDGKLLAVLESDEKNAHSKVITSFISGVFEKAGRNLSSLDAIAVSEGPGSYTGLRIGVATAKGLCYSLEKPLISVPTLESMAMGMAAGLRNASSNLPVLLVPMLDARRMEVYSAIYSMKGEQFRETKAEIITEDSFKELQGKYNLVFGGQGAGKCWPLLEKQAGFSIDEKFRISAVTMIEIADKKYETEDFEDVAYFEPFYLKDFVAGKPRVKGLR